MITSIGAGFLLRLFPANHSSFYHFESFLFTVDWLLEKSLDRKPVPIEEIM